MAVARWLDPINSDGTEVTAWQRKFYLIVITGIGLAGWIGAHLVRIFWMNS
jgi:hypothetical protein